MVEGWKRCKKCRKLKMHEDYYITGGRSRRQCKACVSKANTLRARLTKAWKLRFKDADERRAHARAYYANNKDKFQGYRRKFKDNHPGYYRDYYLKQKKG